MKLKRKHAHIVWGLAIAASLSLCGALYCLAHMYLMGMRLFSVVAVVSCILAFYLRLRWFICPCCEKGLAPPQLRAGKRYYCVRCGKPFIYDDEPNGQVE